MHSLQFHSLNITCNPRFEDDYDNLPHKARTDHKSLDFVQENPWLTRFVKRVAFDMAYCAHIVALFQQAHRLHEDEEIISALVHAAFAELHLFSQVESFTLSLYEFDYAPAFDSALLQHACHLPFWSNLKRLEIKYSDYFDEDPPAQETHSKLRRIIALAPQLHSLQLSLGEYDIQPVLDSIPALPIIPNLTVIDIHCDIAPELALSGVPSVVFKWISQYQHQLTNLNLRMVYNAETPADRKASPRQSPLSKDITVFPRLTFFTVDCVVWPKALASVLATAAPQLRHLSLEIEDEAIEDMIGSVVSLPNLLVLSLHCELSGLQTWTNYFASLSPRLVSLCYYDLGDSDIIGSGTVALNVLARLSLRQSTTMRHEVLSSLLSLFTGPLDLYVLYTGNIPAYRYRNDGRCDRCRPFWPLERTEQGPLEDRLAADCERVIEECRMISEKLQANRSPMSCRIDVSGHGRPGRGCRRCTSAEKNGAMSAVRELCAAGN